MRRVLIAGCGDLGSHAGLALARAGVTVYGLRRDPSALPPPLRPVAADLTVPASLTSLPDALDALVYCPTPGARDEGAYRRCFVDGLSNLLQACPEVADKGRVLFVSSTAVYGQCGGEEVTELAPCEPPRFNGRILLEAEQRVLELSGGQALRLGGIYGPGRDWMIRRLRSGQARCQSEPPKWTNRIHRDDAACAVAHLLQNAPVHQVYNGVDQAPATECQVLDWLAGHLDLSPPQRVSGDDAGKRVLSLRLAETGFQWRYPDFTSGYEALLAGRANSEQ